MLDFEIRRIVEQVKSNGSHDVDGNEHVIYASPTARGIDERLRDHRPDTCEWDGDDVDVSHGEETPVDWHDLGYQVWEGHLCRRGEAHDRVAADEDVNALGSRADDASHEREDAAADEEPSTSEQVAHPA